MWLCIGYTPKAGHKFTVVWEVFGWLWTNSFCASCYDVLRPLVPPISYNYATILVMSKILLICVNLNRQAFESIHSCYPNRQQPNILTSRARSLGWSVLCFSMPNWDLHENHISSSWSCMGPCKGHLGCSRQMQLKSSILLFHYLIIRN